MFRSRIYITVCLVLLLFVLEIMQSCPRRDGMEYVELPVDTAALRKTMTLGPGDVFEVRVHGEKDLSAEYRLAADGTINFPFIGKVKVVGRTPNQLAKEIESRLKDGYLVNPFVSVVVKEYNSKKIYVLGQVTKPGTFPYEGGMNIIQAITLAGGFTPMAKTNSVIVTRMENGVERRISVPAGKISEGLAPNFVLKPGDIVYVPERVL